jgi:hypothetical protein
MMYPTASCRNANVPRYATLGIEMNVMALVSVATTEMRTAHHGMA